MNIVYPVAEYFQSPQGEGQWAGAYFTFIRFAGCNVGKPFSVEESEQHYYNVGEALKPYQEKCCTQLNSTFACDTNYVMAKKMTIEEIVALCDGVERACLTGGEPLLHDLHPLCNALMEAGIYVHLETSGTKDLSSYYHCGEPSWIAVSPKINCLPESLKIADELKILVGPDFNEEKFKDVYGCYMRKVWLQPINFENTINNDNMNRCIELQKKYPLCKISSQSHKLWKVR